MLRHAAKMRTLMERDKLIARLDELSAPGEQCHARQDSGKTEFHGVPPCTAVAVGPGPIDVVGQITGEFPLL